MRISPITTLSSLIAAVEAAKNDEKAQWYVSRVAQARGWDEYVPAEWRTGPRKVTSFRDYTVEEQQTVKEPLSAMAAAIQNYNEGRIDREELLDTALLASIAQTEAGHDELFQLGLTASVEALVSYDRLSSEDSEALVAAAKKPRKVRTKAGEKRFGQPIGSIITPGGKTLKPGDAGYDKMNALIEGKPVKAEKTADGKSIKARLDTGSSSESDAPAKKTKTPDKKWSNHSVPDKDMLSDSALRKAIDELENSATPLNSTAKKNLEELKNENKFREVQDSKEYYDADKALEEAEGAFQRKNPGIDTSSSAGFDAMMADPDVVKAEKQRDSLFKGIENISKHRDSYGIYPEPRWKPTDKSTSDSSSAPAAADKTADKTVDIGGTKFSVTKSKDGRMVLRGTAKNGEKVSGYATISGDWLVYTKKNNVMNAKGLAKTPEDAIKLLNDKLTGEKTESTSSPSTSKKDELKSRASKAFADPADTATPASSSKASAGDSAPTSTADVALPAGATKVSAKTAKMKPEQVTHPGFVADKQKSLGDEIRGLSSKDPRWKEPKTTLADGHTPAAGDKVVDHTGRTGTVKWTEQRYTRVTFDDGTVKTLVNHKLNKAGDSGKV